MFFGHGGVSLLLSVGTSAARSLVPLRCCELLPKLCPPCTRVSCARPPRRRSSYEKSYLLCIIQLCCCDLLVGTAGLWVAVVCLLGELIGSFVAAGQLQVYAIQGIQMLVCFYLHHCTQGRSCLRVRKGSPHAAAMHTLGPSPRTPPSLRISYHALAIPIQSVLWAGCRCCCFEGTVLSGLCCLREVFWHNSRDRSSNLPFCIGLHDCP